jgi:uncharacterized protein VirK/YbjX
MNSIDLSFRTVWRLVGERDAWSPSRLTLRFKKLLVATAHAADQLQILVVLGHPAYRGLKRAYPRLPFKYLQDKYLAYGFTLEERAACLLHHYRRLLDHVPHGILRGLPECAAVLLEMRDEDASYTVTLNLPELFQDEGELSLNLQADGEEIFVLSFTVVPGRVVQSEAENVLLITRLQGVPGKFEQIHQMTKAMHDVGPGAFLVAVLQGIAEAWEIREMAGICALKHRSYEETCAARLTAVYDDFFTELGAVRNGKGFFVSPLPLPQKPLSQVKAGHKLRTREKRAFKQEIAEQVSRALRAL